MKNNDRNEDLASECIYKCYTSYFTLVSCYKCSLRYAFFKIH
jgi:hypothetical protein